MSLKKTFLRRIRIFLRVNTEWNVECIRLPEFRKFSPNNESGQKVDAKEIERPPCLIYNSPAQVCFESGSHTFWKNNQRDRKKTPSHTAHKQYDLTKVPVRGIRVAPVVLFVLTLFCQSGVLPFSGPVHCHFVLDHLRIIWRYLNARDASFLSFVSPFVLLVLLFTPHTLTIPSLDPVRIQLSGVIAKANSQI
jgi:hypothetical protein